MLQGYRSVVWTLTSKQELNLLKLAAGFVAEAGASAPQIVRSNIFTYALGMENLTTPGNSRGGLMYTGPVREGHNGHPG